AVPDSAICRQAKAAGGRKPAGAQVSKAVAIAGNRHKRVGCEVIRHDYVVGPRIMDIHMKNNGRRLWKIVNEFETDSELHKNTLICGTDMHGRAERFATCT